MGTHWRQSNEETNDVQQLCVRPLAFVARSVGRSLQRGRTDGVIRLPYAVNLVFATTFRTLHSQQLLLEVRCFVIVVLFFLFHVFIICFVFLFVLVLV